MSSKQEELNAKIQANKDIRKSRPCSQCRFHVPHIQKYANTGCSTCNFNHDNFKPLKVDQNSEQSTYEV